MKNASVIPPLKRRVGPFGSVQSCCGVLAAVFVFVLLFCLVPYTTGYGFERVTLLNRVLHGYTELENGEWSFGFFVLPAALVMLWMTRARYADIAVRPSWWGLVVIGVALLSYMVGFKANEKYVGYFSGHLLIAGMVVWFLGWRFFFVSFWLWVFAAMMWPLIPLIDLISFPLRKVATETTVLLWNGFGGDALRNGTSIVSAADADWAEGERYSLQVAAACSGMRSLFALFMISLLFAYVGVRKGWHRLVVVGAMIPVAIAGNVLRVLLLLGGTVLWGDAFAVGTDTEPSAYHLAAGFAVYGVALIAMFTLVSGLNGGLSQLRRRRKVVSRRIGGRSAVNHSKVEGGEDPEPI